MTALLAAALILPVRAGTPEVLCRLPGALPDFSREETDCAACYLGCMVADAVRAAGAADAALVNSGDLVRGIAGTEVTRKDIRAVFAENRTLAVAELSAAELSAMLEHALSRIVVDAETETIDRDASAFGGFLQVSGLQVEYDAGAEPGRRVYSITLSDGRRLDPGDRETRLTVAATAYMLDGGYGFPAAAYEPLASGLADALEDWLAAGQLPASTRRIIPLGTTDSAIAAMLPMRLILPVLAAGIVLLALLGEKRRRYRYLTKPMKPGEISRYLCR